MDYYWVGNGGTWSDPDHWALTSGGSGPNPAPGENDDAFFDGNSFGTTGQTVAIDLAACKHFFITDATNSPTFVADGSSPYFQTSYDLTLGTHVIWDYQGTITLVGGGGINITTAGNALYGLAGTANVSMQDALNCGSADINLIGYVKTNGFNLTAGNIYLGGTNSYSDLNFDNSVVTCSLLSLTAANTYGDMYIQNGTLNIDTFNSPAWEGGTERIFFTNEVINVSGWAPQGTLTENIIMTGSRINVSGQAFSGAYGSYNFVDFTVGGTANQVSQNNTFATLSLSGGGTLKFFRGSTTTITEALTVSGVLGTPTYIASTSAGTAFYINKASGTVSVDNIQIKDSVAQGGAVFEAGVEGYDRGGNSGWVFERNSYILTQSPHEASVYSPTPDTLNIVIPKPKFEAFGASKPKFEVIIN